jgi:hypothetical protein
MKTNQHTRFIVWMIVGVISMASMNGIASAQETPVPTEPGVALEVPVEITPEVTPDVTLAPEIPNETPTIIVIPSQIDVTALYVTLVANDLSPVIGNAITVDVVINNPASVGIESFALQCALERVWFAIEPATIEPTPIPVEGQPTPTPIPPVFGENPYIVPFSIDPATNIATLSITATSGVPAFIGGEVYSFNLRATEGGTFNLTCATLIVDSNGVTQGVATVPLAIAVRNSADEAIVIASTPIVIDNAPTLLAPTAIVLADQPTATPTTLAPVTVATDVVVAPPVFTPTPLPVVNSTPAPVATIPPVPGTISGRVLANKPVTVIISNDSGVVATTSTSADGSFIFLNVVPGFYTVTADAKSHLPASGGAGVMPGNTVTMNIVALVPGDLNDDNLAVDANDMALLNITYDSTNTTATIDLDLNGDGKIGLGDLNILAQYMGKVGPTPWQ